MNDPQPELLELTTGSKLSSGGEGVARAADGRVVFVSGAAPEEQVEARVVSEHKRYVRAAVERVISPSPDRVEPRCDHFGDCGGCAMQHIGDDAQLRNKVEAVVETLRRIGGVEIGDFENDPPWRGDAYGYRTRARFAVGTGGVGFRRVGTREIVDIEECPVLSPGLQAGLTALRAAAIPAERVEEVDAIASGERSLVRLPNRLGVRPCQTENVDLLRGRTRRTLDADDGLGALLLAPGVFTQSNAQGNAALVSYVRDLVAPLAPIGHLIELYAGSGNLTRVLASLAEKIHAVEGAADAVRLARRSRIEPVQLIETSVEDYLANLTADADTCVVANPPRTGLSEKAARRIAELAPRSMVYVSCDPATFARDVARLKSLRLQRLRVFDLYPQTPHAELVAKLDSV